MKHTRETVNYFAEVRRRWNPNCCLLLDRDWSKLVCNHNAFPGMARAAESPAFLVKKALQGPGSKWSVEDRSTEDPF